MPGAHDDKLPSAARRLLSGRNGKCPFFQKMKVQCRGADSRPPALERGVENTRVLDYMETIGDIPQSAPERDVVSAAAIPL